MLLAIAAKRVDSKLAAEAGVGEGTGFGVCEGEGVGVGVAFTVTFTPLLQTSFFPDLMQVYL